MSEIAGIAGIKAGLSLMTGEMWVKMTVQMPRIAEKNPNAVTNIAFDIIYVKSKQVFGVKLVWWLDVLDLKRNPYSR